MMSPGIHQPLKSLTGNRGENTAKTGNLKDRVGSTNKKYLRKEKKYTKDMLDDIKEAKPGEWYSKLKKISRLDQEKSEVFEVEEISNFNYQEQAELIADHHGKISNSYEGVKLEDIGIPLFSTKDILQFTPIQIDSYIQRLKTQKATPPEISPNISHSLFQI